MKKRILIAENDVSERARLEEALRALRNEIFSAETGEEALSVLKKTQDIHLIIAGIKLPVLDGIELRKKQLDDETLKHIPIIFLASHLKHAEKAMELEAYSILTKPVQADDLKQIVGNLFHKL